MTPRRSHSPYHRIRLRAVSGGLIAALALTVCGGLSLPVAAQGDPASKLELLVTLDVAARTPVPKFGLRPNVEQEVFVHVKNDGGADKEVIVQLVAGGKVEAQKKFKVAKGATARVPWDRPTTKAAAAQEIASPVQFRLLDGAAVVGERQIGFAAPSSYVGAPKAVFSPQPPTESGATNLLEVAVSRLPDEPISGRPSCRAELDVSPERISGLKPGPIKGVTGGLVPNNPDRALVLYAQDLGLAEKSKGAVRVSVDGYQGAFFYFFETFPTGGATKAETTAATAPVLRTSLPAFAAPKAAFPLTIEADGPLPRARLKLSVLATAGKTAAEDVYAEEEDYPSPRHEVPRFSLAGRSGGVVLQAEVKYWEAKLNFSKVTGKTKVRVSLVDDKGNPLEVFSGVTGAKTSTGVVQEITIDGTPPDEVKLAEQPKVAVRGRMVRLRVQATDKESEISEVIIHRGKPPEAGKPLDPAAILARATRSAKDEKVWEADVPVAAEHRGRLEVTARATNGVGLSKSDTATLDVVGAMAEVAGRVYDKDVPIDNLEVRLLDAKGNRLTKMRTVHGGKYRFVNLDKGATYRVSVNREATNSAAEATITVKGTEAIPLDLNLRAAPPGTGGKGRIAGTVSEGKYTQAGVVVQLVDPAGKVLQTTKTDAQGRYEFRNLPAGNYRVIANRSANQTRAQRATPLQEGEQKTGFNLSLYR